MCNKMALGDDQVDTDRLRKRALEMEWKRRNPDRVTVSAQAARARKLGLTEHFSLQEWQDLCDAYDYKCVRCHYHHSVLTPDHVIPLARGGTNTIDNIQPLCGGCNCQKRAQGIDYRVDPPVILSLSYEEKMIRVPVEMYSEMRDELSRIAKKHGTGCYAYIRQVLQHAIDLDLHADPE